LPKKRDKALSKYSEPNSKNVDRAFNHAKYYATNIYGAVTTQDFRIELLNEKTEYEDGWFFESDAMAILSPTAAKRLSQWLVEAIEDYEKEHGKILVEFGKEKTY
jgi:Protein of unknown function (DUF3467)